MLVVCGLGNVGPKYINTRHNVGFLFLDSLVDQYDVSFSLHKNLHAELARHLIEGIDVLFMKPTTFMNSSGLAVASAMQYYKINSANLIVVHDDVDLPFGKIKLKRGGGSAGHNGIKSVDLNLQMNDYWRIRIGIGRPMLSTEMVDYVLGKFSNFELSQIGEVINNCKVHFLNLILGAKSGSK